jgi:peptidoglycan-N-acetylmuramic acid deacetylase
MLLKNKKVGIRAGIGVCTLALFLTAGILVRQSRKESEEAALPVMSSASWGLSFQEEGKTPVIDADDEELEELDAYYVGDENRKIIYLTFDAGFENGNTEKILDALKKHEVKATFFVVGNYLEKAPEMVKRMVEEGHIVGNHTYHHRDMANVDTEEELLEELHSVEDLYKEITGEDMLKFYRPPQGKYSKEQLTWAKNNGYKTCFWSLAYVDWNTNDQPSKEEAIEKLTKRIHPGAIVLLHSTSDTNGEIMDDLLTKWEEMGYTFGQLTDL